MLECYFGSCIVSAIGQADDVILVDNDLSNLQHQVLITKEHCANYRVKLIPSKIKLATLRPK